MNTASAPPLATLNLSAGPPLEEPQARKALRECLTGGQVTSPSWLPTQGPLAESLADLRSRHLDRLGSASAAVAEWRRLSAAFEREDTQHVEALRQAVASREETPADTRTAEADRNDQLKALRERVEAEVVALAAVVEGIVAELREREDGLVAELAAELTPAAAKRREAERLLAEARAEEFSLTTTAKWLQRCADDNGGFAAQPAPSATAAPPAQWSGIAGHDPLARHWSELRPWNAAFEAEPVEEPASAPAGLVEALS
jgi:hypothetical protein